jgi:hypothetical protein
MDAEGRLKFLLDGHLMWAMIVYEVEQKGAKWSFRSDFQGKNTFHSPFCHKIFGLRPR